jgi:hypothetical protein
VEVKRHETTWRFDPFQDGSELIELAATPAGLAVYKVRRATPGHHHETRELVAALGLDATDARDRLLPPGSVQFNFTSMLAAFRADELHGAFGEQAAYVFMLHWFGLLSGDVRPEFREAFPKYSAWFVEKWRRCLAEGRGA